MEENTKIGNFFIPCLVLQTVLENIKVVNVTFVSIEIFFTTDLSANEMWRKERKEKEFLARFVEITDRKFLIELYKYYSFSYLFCMIMFTKKLHCFTASMNYFAIYMNTLWKSLEASFFDTSIFWTKIMLIVFLNDWHQKYINILPRKMHHVSIAKNQTGERMRE